MTSTDFGTGFRTVAEGMRNEHVERLAKAERILPWGIRFLDDATGGIWPHDLVIVGARTGRGKTSLLTSIARTAVHARRRVHQFALEAEPSEIEMRQKFAELVRRSGRQLQFRDWCRGAYQERWAREIEEQIAAEAEQKNRNWNVFYRMRDFTVDDLEAKILAVQGETDLVIIDHLHFVDSDDDNENRAQRRLVKRLRDVAVTIGKPVIAAAHLRKSDRRSSFLLPDVDDFYGPSDLTKIATKVIIVGPARVKLSEDQKPWMRQTFMHIAKDRMEGGVTDFVALTNYSLRDGRYEDSYTVGRFAERDTTWEIYGSGALPDWLTCKPLTQGSLSL